MADPGVNPTEIDPVHYNRSIKIPWFTLLVIFGIVTSAIYAFVAHKQAKAQAANEAAYTATPTITPTATATPDVDVVRFDPSSPSASPTWETYPTDYSVTRQVTAMVSSTPVLIEVTRIVVHTQVSWVPVVQTVQVPVLITVVVTATPTNTPTMTPTLPATTTPTMTQTPTPSATPTLTATVAAYP